MEDKKRELAQATGLAREKALGAWGAFKKFAFKGNVVDMAVGVIIGAAFGKIVSSLVADIVTPLIGLLTGGADFSGLKWVLTEAVMDGDTVLQAENAIAYGNFLQNVIDFFITAIAIFLVVKALTYRRDKREREAAEVKRLAEEAAAAEAALLPQEPTEVELLKEIRDLLRAQNR